MKFFIAVALLFTSQMALAGKTVRHQHKCPALYRDIDICVNYEFPEFVPTNTEAATPFKVVMYTWESSQSGEREYVDVDGEIKAELFLNDNAGHFISSIPVKLEKVGTGTYLVHDAYFLAPGMWGITVDLKLPGSRLAKRANLYAYIYPDHKE